MCHTVKLSHMLGLREGSLRKLEEGERVVGSRSKEEEEVVLFRFTWFQNRNFATLFPVSDICFQVFSVSVLNRQLNILVNDFLSLMLLVASFGYV